MIATAKDPALTLRMPEPLFKRVERSASKAARSLNSEIVLRLAESFKAKKK